MTTTTRVKIIALTLILGISLQVKSQNTGPVAPETMSFEPVDANNMVNMVTGDFSYVIPLLEVPGPAGGYPIVLSYHGGVAMDQEASWVGLGWNVNPGALNRSINGVPDDWLGKFVATELYADGGIFETWTIGAGVGFGKLFSLGATYTWGSYRAIGINASIGFKDGDEISPFSVSAGLSYNFTYQEWGASVGLGYKFNDNFSLGISAHTSGAIRAGATFTGAKSAIVHMGASMGVTFASGSIYGDMSVMGVGLSMPMHDAINNSDIHKQVLSDINLFLPFFDLSYSHYKAKYWLDREYKDAYYGSLYLNNGKQQMSPSEDSNLTSLIIDGFQSKKVKMDTYLIDNEYNNDSHDRNVLLHPAYDNYSVSAQGLAGGITPSIFDGTLLTHDSYYVSSDKKKELVWYFENSLYSAAGSGFNPQYYISNENNGYVDMNSGSFSASSNSLNSLLFTGTDRVSDLSYLEETFNGFQNNRKTTGNNVQWFTNQQIADGTAKSQGFIVDSIYFSLRGDDGLFDKDGIGGFMITTLDGKKYHYSLPVYQMIEVTRKNGEKVDDFIERFKFDKYAYTWLLTAITGPDYYDKNEDGFANDSDYGYWVNFQYGKHTDGYIWRFPYDLGGETYTTFKDEISWGMKQMYYLDAIETESHIAYFIKENRNDGQSTIFNYNRDKLVNAGWGCIPDDFIDIWNSTYPNNDPCNHCYEYSYSKYSVFNLSTTKSINPMKLSKIFLMNKKSYIIPNFNEVSGENIGIAQLSYKLDAILCQDRDPIDNQMTVVMSYNHLINNVYSIPIKNGNELFTESNISNIEDIKNAAIQSIHLDYSYDLCKNTPNSNALGSGKLTLKSISFKGQNGQRQMPDYVFSYNMLGGNTYNKDKKDLWGYHSDYPQNWSLSEITLPTGGEMRIDYEKNTFKTEAVYGERVPVIWLSNGGTYSKIKPSADIYAFQAGDVVKLNGSIIVEEYVEVDDPYTGQPYGWWQTNYVPFNGNITLTLVNPVDSTFSFLTPTFFPNGDYIQTAGFDGDIENLPINFTQYGGGVRVKSVELVNELGETFSTDYTYTIPETSNTSGTICFSPYQLENKNVPYITELPPPKVIYSYVTVNHRGSEISPISTTYEFEGYQNAIEDGIDFSMGDQFAVVNHQKPDNTLVSTIGGHVDLVYARSSTIVNNFNRAGRLLSVIANNSSGQILSSTYYNYYNSNELLVGYQKEVFTSYKRYYEKLTSSTTRNTHHLTSTGKASYPNVLKEVINESNGLTKVVTNSKVDFYSGSILTTHTKNYDNKEYLTEVIPAYKVYPDMGPMSVNQSQKNMLTQHAASISYIKEDNGPAYNAIGVGVQTWHNQWEERDFSSSSYVDVNLPNVWRKHKTFAWKGDVNDDGTLGSSFDLYNSPSELVANWTHFNRDGQNGWQKTSEVTRYNRYSAPLEVEDIMGRHSSAKTDVNHNLTISNASNSAYNQFTSSGFEESKIDGLYLLIDGEVVANKSNVTVYTSSSAPNNISGPRITSVDAHTGYKYLRVTAGASPCYKAIGVAKAGELYRASVWVHSTSPAARLQLHYTINGGTSTTAITEMMDANNSKQFGSWKLFTKIFTVPGDVKPNSDLSFSFDGNFNSNSYFDDFRVQPIVANVSSFVYDPINGAVTYILNNDNIAVKYEYSDAGQLKAVYKETEDGFKKVSEHNHGFVRPTENVIVLNSISSNTSINYDTEKRVVSISLSITNTDIVARTVYLNVDLQGYGSNIVSASISSNQTKTVYTSFTMDVGGAISRTVTVSGEVSGSQSISIPATPAAIKVVNVWSEQCYMGSVRIYATLKNIGAQYGTFSNLRWVQNGSIYFSIPSFSLSAGQTTTIWKDFSNLSDGLHFFHIGTSDGLLLLHDPLGVSCTSGGGGGPIPIQ